VTYPKAAVALGDACPGEVGWTSHDGSSPVAEVVLLAAILLLTLDLASRADRDES
jgi:hypothetical protein